jgi:flagellar assembly protein FliH
MWSPSLGARYAHAPEAAPAFTSWASRLLPVTVEEEAGEEVVPEPVDPIDPDEVAIGAFARGYEEGCRAMEAEFAVERAAMQQLIAAAEALQPEPPAALAGLIAKTVGRLVRQIVGEAPVDAGLLLARAEAAAALVIDETRPVRMRLCAADCLLLADAGLDLELVADPVLAPGTILIETKDGWIEDGPAAALARLSNQLDRMGIAR